MRIWPLATWLVVGCTGTGTDPQGTTGETGDTATAEPKETDEPDPGTPEVTDSGEEDPAPLASTVLFDFERNSGFLLAPDADVQVEVGADPTIDEGPNRVLEVTRGADAAADAGVLLAQCNSNLGIPPIPLTAERPFVSLRVWSPVAPLPVVLRLEDVTNSRVSVQTRETITRRGWETLFFDFRETFEDSQALDAEASYSKLTLHPGFGQPGDAVTVLVDDIEYVGLEMDDYACPLAVPANNLLANGGFEKVEGGIPADWTAPVLSFVTSARTGDPIDHTEVEATFAAHGGFHGAKMNAWPWAGERRAQVYQELDGMAPGDALSLTGWFYMPGEDPLQGASEATLFLTWLLEDGESFTVRPTLPVSAESLVDVWLPRGLTAEAPENVVGARVGFELTVCTDVTPPCLEEGSFYIDDLLLLEVGD